MPEGNVDTGAIIGSYIGLLFLGASFTAVGLYSSSITKNQVIAFAVSVFLCFLMYTGFDAMAKMDVPAALQDLFVFLSINEHYQSISRGVLDSRDTIYFISLVILFIWLTGYAIGERKW